MYYVYMWYFLMVLSFVSDVVLNIRYEKYKKDKGYRNKYKGAYVFKPLREGKIIKFLANTLARYVIIGYCFEPIIENFLFEAEAKKRIHEEERNESIEYLDPNIIDVEMKLVDEEEGNMQDYEEMKAYSDQREWEISKENERKAQESLNNLVMNLMGVKPEEYEHKEEVIIDEEVKDETSNKETSGKEEDISLGLHLKTPTKQQNDR